MKRYAVRISLFVATIMAQLPLWAHSELFLLRDNDLENFFTPLFVFYKKSIVDSHTFPLWNSLWFGGQPLIADPQSLLLYPSQLLFIFLPISVSILSNIWIHSLLSVYLSYSFFNKHFDKRAAAVISICFIFSTRLAAAIEAGHYGIILAWAWIPGLLLAAYYIAHVTTFLSIVVFGIILALLVQSHLITAMIIASAASIYALVVTKTKVKTFLSLVMATLISFCLLAIVLLPQMAWQPLTTRSLLLTKPEIYPVWQSKREFIYQLLPELGKGNTKDTEKVIGIGFITLTTAIVGFYKLRNKQKALVIAISIPLILFALNNASPISELMSSIKFVQLMRVTTRVWPIVILLILSVVGHLLNITKNKYLFTLISVLCISNSYLLYIHALARAPNTTKPHIENVYNFLKSDSDQFRVYCIDRCFRQKELAENNLEIIDGYATLTQKNYYNKSWSLFGGYWDYYTLAIPPYGTAESSSLTPDYILLGEMNVKYVLSPKPISSNILNEVALIDSYYVYKNLAFRPRLYITDSSRTSITPLTFKKESTQRYVINNIKENKTIIFSEIYSPGWRANNIPIEEAPSNIMSYETKNADQVVFEYKPNSFVVGKLISYLTVVSLVLVGIRRYLSKAKTIRQTKNDSDVYIAKRVAQTSTSYTRKKADPKKVISENKAR